ncbi:methyltransferase, TIGR00027 family [Saccharopolyspora antimicrobica]|uniref:S-adenosyl-L-methionine-dependent methyltransferase n=1 Tax=Saccharopolyspora antimicrobica TaxID=455193 RepID=A0A1I4U0X3_9PSEU|nr:SAM-dependent methyltransferase [Saccharopolyspora antimicrobica]RKT88621.1 methyltransferase (TIGR00027 family) [Saccharopolyspora antimicrobica]SFM82491.1 methyltransferase, TIGR00027 family [Saccharopolyspora antimicrobica]
MGNAAARTAVGPMALVAIDQHEEIPLVRDKLAYRLLPLGAKTVAGLCAAPPVRWAIARAVEKRAPGLWSSLLCRKRYIDDQLRTAAEDGIDAVVLLGAGLDTRAYRLPELAAMPCYEVDLPAGTARKRALVQKVYGRIPDRVGLVPVDFERQDLGEALAAHGCTAERQPFFVWEGVTQYLTEDAIRRTFAFLADARIGSRLVFTYVRADFLDGTDLRDSAALHREYVVKRRLWKSGWAPEEVAGFLAGHGWRLVEQVGRPEFAARYLKPIGRRPVASEVELTVLAEKV